MPLWFARYAPAPIAWLLSPFLAGARRALAAHQRLLFGPRGRLTEFVAASRTLAEYAACLTEALGASRPNAPQPEVLVRGGSDLAPLLATPRGLIVATAHVGPWEAAAAALAGATDRSVLLVMEEERDPAAGHFEDELRRERGLGVVRLGRNPLAALPILEHLSRGGVAAMQIDRPTRQGPWLPAPLFGGAARVPEGPFRLALLADVPILPVFAARLGFMRRLVAIGKPVWPEAVAGERKQERLLALARQVTVQLEAHLREFPFQWFHFVPPGGSGDESGSSRGPKGQKSQGDSRAKVA